MERGAETRESLLSLSLLFCCFAQFAEMIDEPFVVLSLMDTESIPYIAEDDDSAESEIFGYSDMFKVDASECHDFAVDDFVALEFLKGRQREMG